MASFVGVFVGSVVSAAVDELVRIMLPAFLFFSPLFSTGGSDSSVSDGLPMHIIYAAEGLKIVSTIAILSKKLQEKSSKDKWLGMPTKTIFWTLVFVTTVLRNDVMLVGTHPVQRNLQWQSSGWVTITLLGIKLTQAMDWDRGSHFLLMFSRDCIIIFMLKSIVLNLKRAVFTVSGTQKEEEAENKERTQQTSCKGHEN